ncbi:hypothetical protein ACP70R_014723 [Stipagrostis hirtigluma subsp. patula]
MAAAAAVHGRDEASHDDGRHLLPASSSWELPSRRVLRNILRRLPRNPDFAGATFLCKPWLALPGDGGVVVAEPQRVMPGLLLPEDRAVDPAARGILSLADGKLHEVSFPHAGRGARCVGSERGWLVMVERGAPGVAGAAGSDTIHVVHPLLPGQEFRLPDEFSLFEAQIGAPEERYLLWPRLPGQAYMADRPIETSAELLQRVFKAEEAGGRGPYIAEIAISCSPAAAAAGGPDCVALCVYRRRCCLAVARPGDASWVRVRLGWECRGAILSVAHHRGSFYVVCYEGTVLRVTVPPAGSAGAAAAPRLEMFANKPERNWWNLWCQRWWLVGDAGDGGLVFVGLDKCLSTREPRLHVYRWDEALGFWRRPKTFGGRALFLGCRGAAFFADARRLPWCAEDCVYFTGNDRLLRREDIIVRCYDMRSRKTYVVANAGPNEGMVPPVWVMPFHE